MILQEINESVVESSKDVFSSPSLVVHIKSCAIYKRSNNIDLVLFHRG